jgi:hypothetical protein
MAAPRWPAAARAARLEAAGLILALIVAVAVKTLWPLIK